MKNVLGEWKHPDICTGKDEMRATAVTKRFLETAEVLKDNAWRRWLKGTSDLQLPIASCITCGRFLTKVGARRGGPIPTQCAVGVGCREGDVCMPSHSFLRGCLSFRVLEA